MDRAGFPQRRHECFHVGDFPRHEELQSVFRSGVITEVDEAFVNDLGTGFGGNIAPQVHVELACDLEIVRSPGIAH